MESKPTTLIVSDLHMGDGGRGDDFVNNRNQFANFVRTQAATADGLTGQIELIINGDFLEFVQVRPHAYKLNSTEYWCSEQESLAKLDDIVKGHGVVFDALAEFQRFGNRVTLFAGNHDVDLYWDEVQAAIRKKAGNVCFELGSPWYKRYDNRLWISHGHLFESVDPLNWFKRWADPRLNQPDDRLPRRLEMCPGTLFMVRFVNLLEDKYPFADNLHPVTALADILWREDRWGLKTVAWMLTKFAAQFPKVSLSPDAAAPIGRQLRDSIATSPAMRNEVASIYRDVLHEEGVTESQVAARLASEDAIATFVEQLLRANTPWEPWVAALDMAKPLTSGIGAPMSGTLAIAAASAIDARRECIEIARAVWKAGAEVVVLGHTHLPQRLEEGTRRYYNPGSWTRYIDADRMQALKLEDLETEDRYPYQLNCIRVTDAGSANLSSELMTIDETFLYLERNRAVAHDVRGANSQIPRY